MLKVNIELIPFGFGKPESVDTISIINDGSGNSEIGNYYSFVHSDRDNIVKVKKYPRNKKALYLLHLVLKEYFKDHDLNE